MNDNERGREGPRITIEISCNGCRWVNEAYYQVGVLCSACSHPEASTIGHRFIGDCNLRTPDWCPFLAAGAKEETP